VCVILLRVDYLFAIGLDMPIAVAQAIYLLERQMAAVRQVGERYLLPKNSTKLLRKFKKKLLPNYSKPKLIYTPTAPLLPSLL